MRGSPHTAPIAPVLMVANDVTLAHYARMHALSCHLHAQGDAVVLAASPQGHGFVAGFDGPCVDLKTVDRARFGARLRQGAPVFTYPELLTQVAEDLALLDTWRPRVVVGDFRLSLSISARLRHIPYVTVSNAYWSPFARPRFSVPDLPWVGLTGRPLGQILFSLARPLAFALHTIPLNRARRHFGLPSLGSNLGHIYTEADMTVFADVPELVPLHDAPANHHFIGPVPWSPPCALPDWWTSLDNTRPLAYVSLGSSGNPAALAAIAQGLLDAGIQPMIATAGKTPPPLPAGCHVADYLPGDQAAARAALVVCNGGSPTVYQALAQGKPVLGVPSNLDQFLNMYYVEKAGLGLSIRIDAKLAAKVLAASAHLLRTKFSDACMRFSGLFSTNNPGANLRAILGNITPKTDAPIKE